MREVALDPDGWRTQKAGEDRAQVIEVDFLATYGWRVSGIKAPVDEPDHGLGGKPQRREALLAVHGH